MAQDCNASRAGLKSRRVPAVPRSGTGISLLRYPPLKRRATTSRPLRGLEHARNHRRPRTCSVWSQIDCRQSPSRELPIRFPPATCYPERSTCGLFRLFADMAADVRDRLRCSQKVIEPAIVMKRYWAGTEPLFLVLTGSFLLKHLFANVR